MTLCKTASEKAKRTERSMAEQQESKGFEERLPDVEVMQRHMAQSIWDAFQRHKQEQEQN